MKTLRYLSIALALAGLVCVLTGCQAIAAAQDAASKYRELEARYEQVAPQVEAAIDAGKEAITAAKETADEFKQMQQEARIKADTDGDGKLNWQEMIGYLALVASGGTELARRKLRGEHRERTDELYDDVANLREDVATLKAKDAARVDAAIIGPGPKPE